MFNVDYYENWLDDGLASRLFKNLYDSIKLYKHKRTLFYGDGKLPWTPGMLKVKLQLEQFILNKYNLSINFNLCLVNIYESGKYNIDYHKDRFTNPNTMVCGVSLGQERTLAFSNNICFNLKNGSLYLMLPPTNEYYEHSIIKDNSTGVRISLTFRCYK